MTSRKSSHTARNNALLPSATYGTISKAKKAASHQQRLTNAVEKSTEQYCVLPTAQKVFVVFTAALASTFSPLSSNIYYPAINSIAKDLTVTPSMMNFTITAYMLFQGLAPTFMGNLSDTAGRRPVYIMCFAIYLGANVGLALQENYWALLALRALQSTGISATVALSNAVAADIVTSAERGTYLGIASLGGILGPALGPTLGGLTSQYWGWRGIFWLLVMISTAFFVPLALFFPETCRKIVGNGSIPPPAWNRSVLNILTERRLRHQGVDMADSYARRESLARSRKISFPNPLLSLRLLAERPCALVLLANGISYGAYYTVTSSIPAQFADLYGLNDLQLGLSYVPIGLGTISSSLLNGYLIDWNFRRIAAHHGLRHVATGKPDMSDFPIERARLQIAIPAALCSALGIAAYGWLLQAHTSISVAMCMLFLIAYCMTASYNVLNILIVDLNYDIPGAATASNNLVRCTIGAASTASILPLLKATGQGVSYSIVAGIWIGSTPLTVITYLYGLPWRQKRAADKLKHSS
ncbi:hypothetical protein CERZMDRAFT_109648 [Cercospora zeae-maydis SCOH1-5]|uniref:Major facilitator superfamily (MFS) profile domain-containing protein n=1 Tax=Cercospora zeae-maydis SCOH1-5 TaxID=717836 RepID=A0A6A6FQS8_9PEZI|nr:hypothetical protein CERZMDRAFT_109648 [Cercospora zeae-maydis SCOH1-5]